MDSQSQALDDELEAYTKSSENYIESLRESIKDTKLVVEQTFTEVLGNADIVLSKIDRLSKEYGFTIEPNLKNPWVNAAAEATNFKNTADPSVRSLINESGIITTFGSEETKGKLSGVFTAGSSAASQFALDVGTHMGSVKNTVNSYTSKEQAEYLGNKLKAPWDDAGNDTESGPLAFSTKVKGLMDGIVNYAETNFKNQLKEKLDYGFNSATGYNSWGNGVTTMLQGKISEAEAAGRKIAEHLNVQTSSYVGNGSGNGGGNGNGGGQVVNPHIANLQKFLNYWFDASLKEDGIYGSATKTALKSAQTKLSAGLGLDKTYPIYWSDMGKYNERTRAAFVQFVDDQIYKTRKNSNGSSMNGQYIQQMTNTKKWLPTTYFAKGTLGTTRDQLAITDESWIGEEITLAAGKNGQLQYLKKGSAVMPADISANLVEWGKLNPNMMGISSATDGINLMSNYINKPELKLDIENFLKVDTVSKDTLPELEKLMDKKIDTFARQLNASIRKFK